MKSFFAELKRRNQFGSSIAILLYGDIVRFMKTTLDLPDALLRRAKRKALETNTTLKALVISGLKRELQTAGPVHATPLEHLKSIDRSVWRGVKADSYVRELRKGWK